MLAGPAAYARGVDTRAGWFAAGLPGLAEFVTFGCPHAKMHR